MTILAYRMELVPVLWSFIKKCHENKKWSSFSEKLAYLSGDAPGWLLPLAVFVLCTSKIIFFIPVPLLLNFALIPHLMLYNYMVCYKIRHVLITSFLINQAHAHNNWQWGVLWAGEATIVKGHQMPDRYFKTGELFNSIICPKRYPYPPTQDT